MRVPSVKNENPLTWKCKLFGCRKEELPFVWYEEGEKHGIKGFSFATATKAISSYVFTGCHWCSNYDKTFGETDEIWPKWLCDCDICKIK